MPYTKCLDRATLRRLQDDPIRELARLIHDKGDLNYAICELTAQVILREGGMGYTNVSNWIDAVDGAEGELTRRLLFPYEDVKKEDNGDVKSIAKLLEQITPEDTDDI